ncbi:alpha/beta fold hydrolase [Sneathiella chungangensis]|uniref:Alpha/beta fold hydrolase n=1 Tax=Sneathiella chungangensis TaxID=1418234 RepID=A0A845ML11_9PROT|nr:alpha/beta hydrolase [Sneathiella chungangensis]MZR23926.1 alpha/beta fold hydrolase [Sneathiella chungangensis]
MSYAERDIPIYYTELGESDPILFCHGAGGNSTIWWQQFAHFSRQYHCIAMDHRGFGRSSCSSEYFDVSKFGEDALAVLDAAKVERAHIVCQSMGGWTGVQLALKHPERVRSLTLGDTIGGFDIPSGVSEIGPVIERLKEVGGSNVALGAAFRQNQHSDAHLYREISAFNVAIRSLDLYGQMFHPDVLVPLERATNLNAPVLVIAGNEDEFWPPEVLKELSQHIPNARIVELESGHSPYYEVPEVFNETLQAFLETI